MDKKEQQLTKMMEALDCTREEALELLSFDDGDIENEEVEEMTKKAKEFKTQE